MDSLTTSLTVVASISIFSAAFSIGMGSLGSSFGEANIAKEAVHSIAQQPDETSNITKVLLECGTKYHMI